jgi:hypothetical protein
MPMNRDDGLEACTHRPRYGFPAPGTSSCKHTFDVPVELAASMSCSEFAVTLSRGHGRVEMPDFIFQK